MTRPDLKKVREKLKGDEKLVREDRDLLLNLSMMQADEGPLAEPITAYMRREGIETLEDFATLSGIRLSSLQGLVQGRKMPTLAHLMALARVLDRTTHSLLYLVEPNAPGAPGGKRGAA